MVGTQTVLVWYQGVLVSAPYRDRLVGTDSRSGQVNRIIRIRRIRGFRTNDIDLLRTVERETQLLRVTSTAVDLQLHRDVGYSGLGGHDDKLRSGSIDIVGSHHIFVPQSLDWQYVRTIVAVCTKGTCLVDRVEGEAFVDRTKDAQTFAQGFLFLVIGRIPVDRSRVDCDRGRLTCFDGIIHRSAIGELDRDGIVHT